MKFGQSLRTHIDHVLLKHKNVHERDYVDYKGHSLVTTQHEIIY